MLSGIITNGDVRNERTPIPLTLVNKFGDHGIEGPMPNFTGPVGLGSIPQRFEVGHPQNIEQLSHELILKFCSQVCEYL